MAENDVNYLNSNNDDVTIEKNGVQERASLSVVSTARGDSLEVLVQDPTTPAIIAKFNKVTNSTTLTAQPAQYATVITVASTAGMFLPTGIYNGAYLLIFDVTTGRFTPCHVVSIAGLNVTIDTPLDVSYPVGTIVDVSTTNMNVNGSVTPQVFGLRGLGIIPGIPQKYDITRIIFKCLTTDQVSLSLFGDLPKLLKGLVLRRRNGETFNIFNVKSNGEIAGIMLDWIPYSATNPNQGENGFTARLTFSGQEKLGVVQRLAAGEDLEIVVQDNLTGLLLLNIVAEGHRVDE